MKSGRTFHVELQRRLNRELTKMRPLGCYKKVQVHVQEDIDRTHKIEMEYIEEN